MHKFLYYIQYNENDMCVEYLKKKQQFEKN